MFQQLTGINSLRKKRLVIFIWNKGPGAYNIEAPMDGHRVIFQSAENEIKILEVPKPIAVFKSNTDRFKENKVALSPGYIIKVMKVPGLMIPQSPNIDKYPKRIK